MNDRNLVEVKEFFTEKGVAFKVYTPGQSYHSRGVIVYWVGEKPAIFSYENKGITHDGRRVLDLIKLTATNAENGWIFDHINSTRKFSDEKVWGGMNFREWEGIKIVQLPESKKDLEELL